VVHKRDQERFLERGASRKRGKRIAMFVQALIKKGEKKLGHCASSRLEGEIRGRTLERIEKKVEFLKDSSEKEGGGGKKIRRQFEFSWIAKLSRQGEGAIEKGIWGKKQEGKIHIEGH